MTQRLVAYHGKESLKTERIDTIRLHRAAERLVQGTAGVPSRGQQGCAVACTVDGYRHERYPVELGLPEELAHLEDRLFEMMPVEDAMAWPEQFLAAIPVGSDAHAAHHRIMARILLEVAYLEVTRDEWGVREAVKAVAELHAKAARGEILCAFEAAGAAWAAEAARAAWAAEAAGAAGAAWAAGAARAAYNDASRKAVLFMRDLALEELARA